MCSIYLLKMLPNLGKKTINNTILNPPHNFNPNSKVYSNVPWYVFKLAVIPDKSVLP